MLRSCGERDTQFTVSLYVVFFARAVGAKRNADEQTAEADWIRYRESTNRDDVMNRRPGRLSNYIGNLEFILLCFVSLFELAL